MPSDRPTISPRRVLTPHEMDLHAYRDMHVLNELSSRSDLTQRELSKRIGVALGLMNLMLRRLVKKGYLKITGTKRSRIRYLITPKGILEKARLTYEYIHYSLHYYHVVRNFLLDSLLLLPSQGHRKVVLYGVGELAEIVYLTLQELGLECVGIVDDRAHGRTFLTHVVGGVEDILVLEFDRVLITSPQPHTQIFERLLSLGVSAERLMLVPAHPTKTASTTHLSVAQSTPVIRGLVHTEIANG